MFLLQDAFESVRRNVGVVLIYTVAGVVLFVLLRALYLQLVGEIPINEPAPRIPWFSILRAVLSAAVVSALQAVVFARIGRDIDRPLWKCASDVEALARFFMPWLLLNLTYNLIADLYGQALAGGRDDLAAALFFAMLTVYLFLLPVGACIMYHGGLQWHELGAALAPMAGHPAGTAMVVLIRFVAILVVFSIATLEARWTFLINTVWFRPLLIVPDVLLEALAFAAMWRVCMEHRDSAFQQGDDDFDF